MPANCIVPLRRPFEWADDVLVVALPVGLLSLIAGLSGAAVLGAGIVATVLQYRRGKKQIDALANLIECDGTLKRPLSAVPGYVESLIHYRRYIYGGIPVRIGELWYTMGSSYSFKPSGSAQTFDRLDWSHAEGYLVMAGVELDTPLAPSI
jgi:hypothetical protein